MIATLLRHSIIEFCIEYAFENIICNFGTNIPDDMMKYYEYLEEIQFEMLPQRASFAYIRFTSCVRAHYTGSASAFGIADIEFYYQKLRTEMELH